MLLPIADILLIERRICQGCKRTYDTPGIFIHRLESSPEGELSKKVMHSRRDLGHEKGADVAVSLRSTRVFEVFVPHCQACWEPNISWNNANSIVPTRPERDLSVEGRIASAHAQAQGRTVKVPKGGWKPLPDTISAKDL